MHRFPKDETPTNPGTPSTRKSLADLEELVGKVMADQVRLRREVGEVRKVSRRPAPIIDNRKLGIIITVASFIVGSIITTLRELGILK